MGYYRVLIAVVVVYLQMGAFYISKHLSWQWFSRLMAYHPEPEYSTCLISEKHPNTSLVTYPLWKFNHQKSVFWKREKCLSQKLHFFLLIPKKKKNPSTFRIQTRHTFEFLQHSFYYLNRWKISKNHQIISKTKVGQL